MKKVFIGLVSIFAVAIALAMAFNQSWNNPGHRQSFSMVMDGLSGENFNSVCKAVSDSADAKCMSYYREVGLMKGVENHRFMGHWGWSADIPKEVFERAAKMNPPVSRDVVVSIWQCIHKETVEIVMEKTGLPKQFAEPFAGILYDTHLLHDFTGHFANALQDPNAIQQDIIKNLHRLFGNNSNFVKAIESELRVALKNVPLADKPRVIMNILIKHDIGKHIQSSFGERYLIPNGIVYKESVAAKIATGSKVVNEQFFMKSLSSAIKDCGQRIDNVKVERVVKGLYTEIEKNGRKAYRLQIPLQFTPEERIASEYAKQCLSASNGKLSQEQLAGLVAQRLRDSHAVDVSAKTLTNENISRIANNSAQWAKLNQGKAMLGLKAGVLTFIISEGITVCTFAATDMGEEEFWNETLKNTGGAILHGTATMVLVALGANPFTWPGGLIVVGVGIGTQIVYDFAWRRLNRYLDSMYFMLDDFVGNLPIEIRDRVTVLSEIEFEMVDENNRQRLNSINYLLNLEQREISSLDLCTGQGSDTLFEDDAKHENVFSPLKKTNSLEYFNNTKRSKNEE